MEEGGNDIIFLFSLLFAVSEMNKSFWGITNKCENENYVIFLFQLIILGCLWPDWLIKFFLLGFSYLKYGNKHETCFYKYTF